ncbi:hypothetical protein PYV61_26220, partial [Roseisolibacter sp. H3M3-2]
SADAQPPAPETRAPEARIAEPPAPTPLAERLARNVGGEWAMRAATADEVGGGAPAVHVMLWSPGMNTFVLERARFDGLAPAALTSGGDASFTMRRDAGTFRFVGQFRDGRGRGRFVFQPSSAFADSLERLGMDRPTPAQQFELARHGLELAFLDELAAQGYERPTTRELARVALTGVDLAYLRAMGALGYRFGRVAALVRLSNQGVDPAFVRSLGALGRPALPAAELLRLRADGDVARGRSADP